MRVRLRLISIVCLIASTALLVPYGGANAAAPNRVGWWYKLNQGDLGGYGIVIPQPPNAEAEGLYVANDNDRAQGPLAISAVEFVVQVGGDAKLTLRAGQNSSFSNAAIAACPAASQWSQAFGGNWAERPAFNCTLGKVLGTASADGAMMTWDLTSRLLVNPTTYNIVLLPDPDNFGPFTVGIKPPGEDALSAPQPPASQPSGFTAPAGEPPAARAAARFSSPTSLPSDPILPLLGEDTGLTAPPVQTAPRRALPALQVGDSTTERLAASALLALIAVGLALIASRQAGAGGTLAGGIGRFARPRDAIPTRL